MSLNPSAGGFSSRRANFGGALTHPDPSTTSNTAQSSISSTTANTNTTSGSTSSSHPPRSSNNHHSHQQQQPRSNNKGKSKANHQTKPKQQLSNASSSTLPQQPPSQASIQAIATAAAAAAAAAASENDVNGQAQEEESLCLICADEATFWAVGVCGHRTCHTCSIRLRALYKKKECTLCKTECPRVVFTISPDRPYTDYPESVVPFSDAKLGISFETREQMDDSLALLRFNCPVVTCEAICLGWADLKRHVRSTHQQQLCDLCCSNKKIFAHEHTVYSTKELNQHVTNDHYSCEFCRRAFYDSDQLYAHCRDAHEECFICVRQGIRHQYHLNYSQLEAHYKACHYLCPHPNCLEKKFIVFETEIDLQAHAVAEHGAALAGDQRSRRDARRIETNFTYETAEAPFVSTSAGSRGGRGGRRGGGRAGNEGGRDTGLAAAFVQTTDAPNRNRVIPGLGPSNGASSSRANRFNSTLTTSDGPSGSGANSAATSGRATPDHGTVEKHAHIMRLVTEAVNGSEAKTTTFKLAIRAYRSNEVAADDLVDQLWNIFDQNVDKAGPIISGVADLMEDNDKKALLHGAWRDRRIEQNQFPSLTALAPTLHGTPTTTHNSSPRALNSRATRNQRDPTVWARVEQAANRAAPVVNPFPALSSARNVVPGMPRQPATGTSHHTPWSASASVGTPSTTTTSSRYTSPSPSLGSMPPLPSSSSLTATATPLVRARQPPKPSSGMEFPSLPVSTAEIDRRARIKAAMGKPSQTIMDNLSPPITERNASPWGGSIGSGVSTPVSEREDHGAEMGNAAGGVGKKKKKTKVLLMSHGVHRG